MEKHRNPTTENIDVSEDWTDEDMSDVTLASLRYAAELEQDEDGETLPHSDTHQELDDTVAKTFGSRKPRNSAENAK